MSMTNFPRVGQFRGHAAAPIARPAYVRNAPLNAWVEIPNTSGVLGYASDAWGAIAMRDDGDGLVQSVILAGGGHTNSNDNRVFSIDWSDENPAWVVRVIASVTKYSSNSGNTANTRTNYYSWDVTPGDNPKPGSSHLYDYLGWSKYAQKYYRYGATGTYILGDFSQCVDSIAPIDIGGGIWQWDAPGTNPLFPYNSNGASQARGNPNDGYIWCAGYKWRPGDSSWSVQSIYNSPYTDKARFPFAYDISRDCIFNFQYGDGQDRGSFGDVVLAKQTFLTAGTHRSITLSAGAALTKFLADKPDYAGMDYDSYNDYYLFMYDRNDGVNIQGLMKINPDPAGTANWTIENFTIAGGGVTPGRTPTDGSGVNGRLKYSPTMGGFYYISKSSDNVYFMKTKL